MDRLLLFDIDKTLLKDSETHIRAFSEAFKAVYDVETSIGIINPNGMTDRQIIIEVLKRKGLDERRIKYCNEKTGKNWVKKLFQARRFRK